MAGQIVSYFSDDFMNFVYYYYLFTGIDDTKNPLKY